MVRVVLKSLSLQLYRYAGGRYAHTVTVADIERLGSLLHANTYTGTTVGTEFSTMPRGRGVQQPVRAAEARVAQADVKVMSAIAGRVTAANVMGAVPAAPIAELSAEATLDAFDVLTTSGCLQDTVRKAERERCVACLERCEDLWDDAWDEDEGIWDVKLPHDRALVAAGISMWLACERGDIGGKKCDRKLLVYACMLIRALLAPVVDCHDDEGGRLVGAPCTLVDRAETTLRQRTGDTSATLLRLLATGLGMLDAAAGGQRSSQAGDAQSAPAPSVTADVTVPVLGALCELIRAFVRPADPGDGSGGYGGGGDDRPTTASTEDTLPMRALPVSRAVALFDSGALAAALATAAVHAASPELQRGVVHVLSATAGDAPEQLLLPDGGAESDQPISMADRLVAIGALPPVVCAIRRHTTHPRLMASAVHLVDALTSTGGGRRAARECDAAGALDSLIQLCAGIAADDGGGGNVCDGDCGTLASLDVGRLKVLRAVVHSDDLASVLNELAPGSVPTEDAGVSGREAAAEADGREAEAEAAGREAEEEVEAAGRKAEAETAGREAEAEAGPPVAQTWGGQLGETASYWY